MMEDLTQKVTDLREHIDILQMRINALEAGHSVQRERITNLDAVLCKSLKNCASVERVDFLADRVALQEEETEKEITTQQEAIEGIEASLCDLNQAITKCASRNHLAKVEESVSFAHTRIDQWEAHFSSSPRVDTHEHRLDVIEASLGKYGDLSSRVALIHSENKKLANEMVSLTNSFHQCVTLMHKAAAKPPATSTRQWKYHIVTTEGLQPKDFADYVNTQTSGGYRLLQVIPCGTRPYDDEYIFIFELEVS